MKEKRATDAILFACAGCSSGGQTAYTLALSLNNLGIAEMSCLAGIACGKPSFLRKVKNRKIVTIDGCSTECSKGVFDKLNIEVSLHIKLKDFHVEKNKPFHGDINQLTKRIIRHIKDNYQN